MEHEEKSALLELFKSLREPHFMGIKVNTWVTICVMLLAVHAFYIRTNDAMTRLIELGEYTKTFMTNSDNYHSSLMGVQFNQGRPFASVPETEQINKMKKLFNKRS